MATVGGNLIVGGDVATALLALDAEVRTSDRTMPLHELWSSFRPDAEIVVSVSFEDDPRSIYLRLARRAANSPAVVSVAVSRGREVSRAAEHSIAADAQLAFFLKIRYAGRG